MIHKKFYAIIFDKGVIKLGKLNTSPVFNQVGEYVVNIEDVQIAILTEMNPTVNVNTATVFLHSHSGYEVFCLNERTTMEIMFDSETVTVYPCETIIISPGVNHRIIKISREPVKSLRENFAMIFSFKSNELYTGFSLYKAFVKTFDKKYLILSDFPTPGKYVLNLEKSLSDSAYFELHSDVYMFFNNILKITGEAEIDVLFDLQNYTYDSIMSRKQKIHRYLESHIDTDVSLAGISESLGLSTRQTSRVIKELFSLSWRDFVTYSKIEKAKNLISNGSVSVNEIMSKVGFRSEKGFYEAFKRFTGYSPVKYKKLLDNEKVD